jgi:hypothetical protein
MKAEAPHGSCALVYRAQSLEQMRRLAGRQQLALSQKDATYCYCAAPPPPNTTQLPAVTACAVAPDPPTRAHRYVRLPMHKQSAHCPHHLFPRDAQALACQVLSSSEPPTNPA